MKNLKFIKENNYIKKYIFLIILLLACSIFYIYPFSTSQASIESDRLWQIQSIDTMKTSRDKARAELYNSDFDKKIEKELTAIKNTGANYVAIDTPYDNEFIPYLKRWVKLARKTGLHVWFRGNWSEWEGWFDYPINLTPDEHIKKTSAFIQEHPELFEDEDIFEGCPECENAKHWKQPEKNKEYNEYLKLQRASNKEAFEKINKNVMTNIVSVIGGRAKEVLDQGTFDAHENVVSIDHYVKNPKLMREYINYFKDKFDAQIVISEFGAPVPDINGPMNEDQQAVFINSIFEEFYKSQNSILGINYFVSSGGTTPILNTDYTPKKAYFIVKNYFTPGIVTGKIRDPLGNPLQDVQVRTGDAVISVKTDKDGNYKFAIPPRTVIVVAGGDNYNLINSSIKIEASGNKITKNFLVTPKNPGLIYKLRLFWKQFQEKS